jgi:long-chain acyl-CoA synthetase
MTNPITTVTRMFLDACRTHLKPDLFLVKRAGSFRPVSTAEFAAGVRDLALGFREFGLAPGGKAVLLSENRPEWVMVDLAVQCAGGITVPIYTSLLPEQIRHIIDDSDAELVVCSGRELGLKVESVRKDLPKVRDLLMIDRDGVSGHPALEDVADLGRRTAAADRGLFERLALAVRPGDLASIIYTSGTTGPPKGVMLSHGNFISNIESVRRIVDFRPTDTVLSFLPLSHVLERTATYVFLRSGATIACAESIEAVSENLVEVRPTIMVSVPRLFEKMYTRVMEMVLKTSAARRALFFWALNVGKRAAAREIGRRRIPTLLGLKRSLARRFVFSKILERTGGRVRFFICGGAPLAADIAEFFLAMGLIILPGYGLTESAPVLTGNTLDAYRLGSAGRAIPGVELRIAADGEILARGPNVMQGYYKREAETRQVLEGGWLHTGDIGHLDDDGFLFITDRKKDLIVTAGGKNVAPQPIESLLGLSPYISNAVVVGERRRFISALVVPNFEKLEAYARSIHIRFRDRAELCRRGDIVNFMQAEVDRSTPELASYERVKKIALLDHDFELAAGEVTPTLKVRRAIVEDKYKDLIDSLYAE